MAIENVRDQRELEIWEARQAGENFSVIPEKVASDEVLLAEYLDAAETEMTNTIIAIEGKDGFDRSPERITELENELDRARDAVAAAYKITAAENLKKEILAAKEMGAAEIAYAEASLADQMQRRDKLNTEFSAIEKAENPPEQTLGEVLTDLERAKDILAAEKAKGNLLDSENVDSKINEIADDRFPDVKPGDLSKLLPEKIEHDYVQVGNKFHYGFKPELEAFQDNGNSIQTKSTGETVAKDIVSIAAARDWSSISVKGSDDFKRQVWIEASLKNIPVKGYKPSDADRASLIKAKEKQPELTASSKDDKDAKGAPDAAKATSKEKADALRAGDASATLKRFPELINAYALIKAAELLAEKRIQNTDGKVAFVSSVKDALANQVERGQTIPDVQYQDRSKQAEPELSQSR